MQFAPDEHSQFRIVSALDQEMILDCAADHRVLLWKWHKGANQRWRVISVNGKFAIQNVQHSTMMRTNDHSNGTQAECHMSKKQANEIWQLVPCNQPQYYGKNAFYLRSHCGKALDVCEGNATNGQKIIQWDYNGNKNQIWFVEPVGFIPHPNTPYKIVTALNHGQALDVSQNPNDLGNLILWTWSKSANQKYMFGVHNGKYTLISCKNHHALQVPGNDNGGRLKTGVASNQAHELFEIIPCHHPEYKNKEAFYIKTHSGKYLDVAGGDAKNEAKIIQWNYNGNKNQIWFIENC